jgi:putative membrane protein
VSRAKTTFVGILIGLYLIIWTWAAWEPVNRFIWFLENILIFLFLIVFILMHQRFAFSATSYLFIFLFLTLHTIGAHYSYQTPIDPWLRQWFELDRAYYDRIVHLSFGLFMIIPIRDWLAQLIAESNQKLVDFFSVITLFSAGAFYELIEMWVANIVAPEQGTSFIGLQGDPWDTQHDMELALYGSLITLFVYHLITWISKKTRLRKTA